jgi:hypothetical protein
LDAPSGDRKEGQRRHRGGVADFGGRLLGVVRRVIVADGFGKLANLFATHVEIVGVPIMRPDQVLGACGQ